MWHGNDAASEAAAVTKPRERSMAVSNCLEREMRQNHQKCDRTFSWQLAGDLVISILHEASRNSVKDVSRCGNERGRTCGTGVNGSNCVFSAKRRVTI